MINSQVLTEMEDQAERFSDRVMEQIDNDPQNRYDSLQAYLHPMRKFSVLRNPDHYLPYFEILINGADREKTRARDQLVYGNIKLVVWVALQYAGRKKSLPLLDMMQEGVIGLMRAIEKYDPGTGYRFATYAPWWIRQSITRALQDTLYERPYRIPVHMAEKIALVRRAMGAFMKQNGRWGNYLELFTLIRTWDSEAARTIRLHQVRRMARYIIQGDDMSLEGDGPGEDGEERDDSLGEVLTAKPAHTETIVEAAGLLADYKSALARIEKAIDGLLPREAQILRLRFGLGEFEPLTLEEVGVRYDLTRERIRQIEEKALAKISTTLQVSADDIVKIVDVIDELEHIVGSV